MAFKNVGTFDLGRAASGAARGGNAAVFSLDADGIASGQAFLTSELEKRDMMVRTPDVYKRQGAIRTFLQQISIGDQPRNKMFIHPVAIIDITGILHIVCLLYTSRCV